MTNANHVGTKVMLCPACHKPYQNPAWSTATNTSRGLFKYRCRDCRATFDLRDMVEACMTKKRDGTYCYRVKGECRYHSDAGEVDG